MESQSNQWQRFVKGLAADGRLRPVIYDSWRRSREATVDPQPSEPSYRHVGPEDLQRRLEENAWWVALATPHLEWLGVALSQVSFAAYLTDRDGVVLHSIGTPEVLESYRLTPGFDWSERQMGTNGAGTALAAEQPVAVIGGEHFTEQFQDCTCTAAPIHDPQGRLIGAIDVSTSVADATPDRLAMVAHLAHIIQREIAFGAQEAELRRAHRSSQRKEQLLSCALDAARMVAWDWNLSTGQVHRSEQAAAILGLQSGAPDDFLRMIHPEDRDRVEQAFAAAKQGSEIQKLEFRVVLPTGRTLWVSASAALRIDPETQQPHLAGVCLDLTDRKRSEALFRASQEASTYGFAILHSVTGGDGRVEDFKCEYINPAAAAILKRPLDQLRGRYLLEVLPSSRVNNDLFERLRRVVETGKPDDNETRYDGDGLDGWFRTIAVKLEDGVAVSFTDMTDRKLAELQIEASEKRFREMANTAPVVIWVTDAGGYCTFISEHWERLVGQSVAEALGFGWLERIHPEDRASTKSQLMAATKKKSDFFLEYRFLDRNGHYRWAIGAGRPRFTRDGTCDAYIGCVLDITEHRQLEERLRQSQKMEAFGQLAGGVAHDFNNLLTIISGNSETLSELLPPDDSRQEYVSEITAAGKRAASLTQQLLAFSRQTMLTSKVLNLNAVVSETEKMLRRLIGEDVRLSLRQEPNLRLMKLDPGQCEQILMNLAVNARDAMPRGGELTIATSNVSLDGRTAAAHPEATVGDYVRLTVKDTGSGMTPEVQARLFEPYFTTKQVGKGTGLGLAVVHGIVSQNGGYIQVQSEPGAGAVFQLHFPAVAGSAPAPKHEASAEPAPGTESLLLVEDEDAVRRLLLRVLEQQGYKVSVACNGREALALLEDHREPIDLLVTDVVMPELGGPELAHALCPRFPEMRVLFLSGHTDDAMVRHGLVQDDVAFLQKPFSPLALAKKVREVLDATN